MELRQYLKLSQQLVMTPQLQQAIKLLQLSRLELSDVIHEEMLENPVLEEMHEIEAEKPKRDEPLDQGADSGPKAEQPAVEEKTVPGEMDWERFVEHYNNYNSTYAPSYRLNDEEMPSYEATLTRRSTLFDHLVWQLKMSDLRLEEHDIARAIIGNIDDDGYLTIELTEISEELDCTIDEIEDVLCLVHDFDPIGVGARSLKECLLMQADYYHSTNTLLRKVIKHHLGDLERRDIAPILKGLGIRKEELATCARIIGNMEPKPGRTFSPEEPHYITPDIYVFKISDEFVTVLNEDGLPKLRISQFYRSAMAGSQKGTKDYIQDKFRSAVWLIRSIHQRQNTIRKVTESIVKFQREFFERGVQHLKPLILRDVAEDIGMHESTISRVTTNKYVHTPQGIFELKYFFNSKISGGAGHDLASESVKQKIKGLIAAENPKKPYSDQKLATILQEQDIDIARRTVAKYREMLGILSSSKRKTLF